MPSTTDRTPIILGEVFYSERLVNETIARVATRHNNDVARWWNNLNRLSAIGRGVTAPAYIPNPNRGYHVYDVCGTSSSDSGTCATGRESP